MNKNVQVKKLVSLNPRRYEKVSLAFASFDYEIYLRNFKKTEWLRKGLRHEDQSKTFIQWLETEI